MVVAVHRCGFTLFDCWDARILNPGIWSFHLRIRKYMIGWSSSTIFASISIFSRKFHEKVILREKLLSITRHATKLPCSVLPLRFPVRIFSSLIPPYHSFIIYLGHSSNRDHGLCFSYLSIGLFRYTHHISHTSVGVDKLADWATDSYTHIYIVLAIPRCIARMTSETSTFFL